MSVRRIIQAFETWRASGQPIVLATVFETAGSTYTKAGHRILIAAHGDYQGLVSGGCLEGDLAERARSVVATGEPLAVTYDLRDDADDLWGLGVGCNGLLRVFLQPLDPAGGYQPFAAIAERLVGKRRCAVATVIEAANGLRAGGTVIVDETAHEAWQIDEQGARALLPACRDTLRSGGSRFARDESGSAVLFALLRPVPRLLVLGGGLDAVPLVDMAASLGWFVSVADHRPAYIARGGFERAERVLLIEPARLAEQVPLREFDAVVVMSHHLATDRAYLVQLADLNLAFVGVLGPPARKERLLADLGAAERDALGSRLRGPVGLDIGADSPESIALSILAELQAALARRAV